MGEAAGSERLHRKYRDWCSARLAEHFLQLSPEEIYALSQEAAPPEDTVAAALFPGSEEDTPGGARRPSSTPSPDPAEHPSITASSSYRQLIERVTGTLAERIGLPSFEQWAAAYQEDPERFERELWEADGTGTSSDA